MPEREISLAQVVLVGMILLAVILGIVFVFIVPNINTVKQSGSLEFACTTYQGDVGCVNKACGSEYDEAACKSLLQKVSIKVKDTTINLWAECDKAGISDAKNCHIRCCGILAAGKGAACNGETVKCQAGLTCDAASKKCV